MALGMLALFLGIFVLLKVAGLGHIPGDIVVKKKNFTLYFPLGTSILISIVLTILLNLIFRRR